PLRNAARPRAGRATRLRFCENVSSPACRDTLCTRQRTASMCPAARRCASSGRNAQAANYTEAKAQGTGRGPGSPGANGVDPAEQGGMRVDRVVGGDIDHGIAGCDEARDREVTIAVDPVADVDDGGRQHQLIDRRPGGRHAGLAEGATEQFEAAVVASTAL